MTPEIRFNEFTQDWEQRKLREMAENFEYGLNASATNYDGENKYLRITDIDDESRTFIKDRLTSPEFELKKADNYLLQQYDILFARTGATVGKTYRYDKKDGKVYYAGYLIRARIKSVYNTEFVFQNTLTDKYEKFIRITSQRSGQPGVNANEYGSFEIFVPILEEQTKIGMFLKKIDDTIALHQDKLDKLKQLKKGYLQLMFPQKGEKIPTLRFAHFPFNWEQRRLKQLGEIQTGNTPSTNDIKNYDDGGTLWVTPTDIKSLITLNTAKKLSTEGARKARIAKAGSILVTSIASIGKNTLATKDMGFNQQINSLTPFSENDSYFLLTQSKIWSKKMKRSASSGTMQIVNKSEFSNITTLVPKFEEQKKIGNFFKQIDDTIALHQKKISILQEIKKLYLQKMFA